MQGNGLEKESWAHLPVLVRFRHPFGSPRMVPEQVKLMCCGARSEDTPSSSLDKTGHVDAVGGAGRSW